MGEHWAASARPRKLIAGVIALGLVAGLGLTAISATIAPAPAAVAADASRFEPGNIISDSIFFDKDAMSVGQIQQFLNGKVPSCAAGYTCLKDYTENTRTLAATPMCSSYPGAVGESAATIIYKVAQTCGLNPQVLLVILQREQSLVDASRPSAYSYRSAMGAGCPDTGACDAEYYGFFNQVHYGAYLLKRYTQPPGTGAGTEYYTRFDLWYPVGATSQILYNPNSACGTKSVYIENQATHALYIYTPYTPNAAALAAGSGIGDGCSSYGNRNFYLLFSDWFGDPHASFIRTSSDPTLYYLSRGVKHLIAEPATYVMYKSLSSVRYVSQSYLDSYPTGVPLTQLVRNADNGYIYLYDGRQRHFVTSCAQLPDFLTSCDEYVDFAPGAIATLAEGAPLSKFVGVYGTPDIYYVDSGTARWLIDSKDVLATNGGTAPNYMIGTMATLSRLTPVAPSISEGTVVTSASSTTRYLVSAPGAITPLTAAGGAGSGELRSGLSSTSAVTVPSGVVSAFATGPSLALAISCDSTVYLAGAGKLRPLADGDPRGLPVTTLSAAACAVLPKAAIYENNDLLVRDPVSGYIYVLEGGTKRFVPTAATLRALTSVSTGPVWIDMSSAGLASIPTGAAVVAPGSAITISGSAVSYLVDGLDRKVTMPTVDMRAAFGISSTVVSESAASGLSTSDDPLSMVVQCGDALYLAAQGRLIRLSGGDSYGLPVTTLAASTCSAFSVSSTVHSGPRLLLRDAASGSIYLIDDGTKQFVATMAEFWRLSAGVTPAYINTSAAMLGTIDTELVVAPLMKSSDSPVIYLIDGPDRKIPLRAWVNATEIGLTSYTTAPSSQLAAYSTSSDPLGLVLQCDSELYLAGAGKIWHLTASGSAGLPVTQLHQATCADFPAGPEFSAASLLVRDPSSGYIYVIEDGKKRFIRSMASYLSLAAAASPGWIDVTGAALATIPSGQDIP